MKKILKAMPILVAIMVFTIMSSVSVKAVEARIASSRNVALKCVNHTWGERVEINDNGMVYNNAKIVSVKSSNKSVVKVNKESTEDSYYWGALKKGTATITVKVKYKGKTYTVNKKVRVVDDKPFEYIKYGTKNVYKGNEYKSNFFDAKKSQKLTWKLKKGYTLVDVNAYSAGKEVTFKKNDYLPLSKKQSSFVEFTIKNAKGQELVYRIFVTKK